MKKERTSLRLAELEPNTGQLEWLPKNPRQWTQDDIDRTAKSIAEDYDFLEDRPLLAVPAGDTFVVFAGNLRLTAARQSKVDSVPVIVYTVESEDDQQTILRRAMKDNGSFGAWDWDALANEWDDLPLGDWGVPAWPSIDDEGKSVGDGDASGSGSEEKVESVEDMLNAATKKAAGEVLSQIDKLGGGITFITPHTAKVDFIKFAYYGGNYRRFNSLGFHPQQISTAGDSMGSVTAGLAAVRDGGIKAERLRFVTGDDFSDLRNAGLPFNGYRMPADFPAELSKALIDEFAPEGGIVLDPCSGWGGRLVGFLASHAAHYEGVDASPLQIAGDKLIYETFKDVAVEPKKSVKLNTSPFEEFALKEQSYDFALTSPPYFDTEKYEGGKQSYDNKDNYEDWRDNFYVVLIDKVFRALKSGAHFCLQVGSQRYPLREDGIEIATRVGFQYIETRTTDMRNNFCGTSDEDGEVVIVLRKPQK